MKAFNLSFVIMALMSILIGFYPLVYLFVDNTYGLLASKSPALLESLLWKTAFFGHILPGGIALLTGWTQFNASWRKRYPAQHRFVGKVYLLAVSLSALSAIFLSFYATGGLITGTGFFFLGIVWLFSSLHAFLAARSGDYKQHRIYMTFSFAACFGAVTLRIWMPLLSMLIDDFITMYKIVAWLSWVPNLIVAYFILKRQKLI